MDKNVCDCKHHSISKVLALLMWVAAVGFFITVFRGGTFISLSASELFNSVVVFGVLAFASGGACGCCKE